jgi:hypothetical protein
MSSQERVSQFLTTFTFSNPALRFISMILILQRADQMGRRPEYFMGHELITLYHTTTAEQAQNAYPGIQKT